MNPPRKVRVGGNETLSLPANRESFITLRNWLEAIAGEWDIPEKIRTKLLIVADEIFTNIASYAYPSGNGTVDVSMTYAPEKDCLVLEFADSGIPFNPLETAEPDTSLPPEERPIGGLGIFLVRQFMDSLEYRRENDRNVLVLRKKTDRMPSSVHPEQF